mgnify:CR=1 FL=1
MTPIVNGLQEEFAGDINVLNLNVAEAQNDDLQQEFGLRGHPAFVILDENNQVLETMIGPQTEAVLRTAVLQALPSNK